MLLAYIPPNTAYLINYNFSFAERKRNLYLLLLILGRNCFALSNIDAYDDVNYT
jgi:hypothetical protein